MSILRDLASRLFGRWAPGRELRSIENPNVPLSDIDAWDDLGLLTTSDSGARVNLKSMLSVPAVWKAVGDISGDVSRLPLQVFRRDGKDRDQDSEHAASGLIGPYAKANPDTSAVMLWRRLMTHALIYPRGFVWIDRRGDGAPQGLYNLLPDRTYTARHDGRLWVISEVGGHIEALPADDVLIVENLSIDACLAFGVLRAARHNIGLQLAKRRFTAKFFGNGLHAGGILQVPPGASDKARQKVEKSIEEKGKDAKNNAFKTLVLRDGFKWHQTMVSPEAAQGDKIEEGEVRNIARFYRMQPSRLGVKDSVSYNSAEADRRAYHDETLSYWLVGIRTEANIKLLTETERTRRTHFIDYNIHALNWADTNTVMSVGTRGVQWGIFTRNEVRRWFNFNGLADGDKPYRPKNMEVVGASASAARDALDAQQRADMQAALDALITETAGRMAGRLSIQAAKAARADRMAAWLDTFARDQAETLAAMWRPVRDACRAAGYGRDVDVPARLCDRLATTIRSDSEQPLGARLDLYRDAAGPDLVRHFRGNDGPPEGGTTNQDGE